MSQCKHVTEKIPNDVLFVEINANDDSKNGLGATEPQKTKLPDLKTQNQEPWSFGKISIELDQKNQ